MKILCHNRERGSVLVTSLIVGLAAGITLASYLLLISNRYRMTVRSMDWTKAMPVLEAGIEEALTHLHDEFTNLSANGWTAGTLTGQPVFSKFRTNSDGSYFWTAIVTNGYFTNPIIYSSGFVPVPSGKGYICRTVTVTTSRPLQFVNAVAASGLINFNGNNGYVDAYSSCNGSYGGTNSHGSTSMVTSYNGTPAIEIGNATMYGMLNTAAGGTVTVGPNGSVGDSTWISNSSDTGKIEPGYTNANMTQSFPSNSPPADWQTWSIPTVVTNATVLTGGNYQISNLSSGTGSPVIVSGPSTLYVSGNVNISGSGYIQILPGGSLTIYVAGGSTSLGGLGVINGSSAPENFSYIGLAGNTTINFGGSTAFYGTINAPEADFTAGGLADVFGAAIVKSFTIGGNASFHYDRCLGLLGNLVVTSWQETL